MVCRTNGFIPDLSVFHNFFRFVSSSSGESYMFAVRKHSHILMADGKNSPKNWANRYYCVSVDRVGFMDPHTSLISYKSFGFYSDKE